MSRFPTLRTGRPEDVDAVLALWRRAEASPSPTESPADLRGLLARLIPADENYEHNRRNHDTNAHAHLRAAVIGPSESIPVIGGRLALGTWQQIVLLDFDDRPRDRTVLVDVLS